MEVSSTLNITRINRLHMGVYTCEANNGIPPVARQNFSVEVHCKGFFLSCSGLDSLKFTPNNKHGVSASPVAPLIEIHEHLVGGYRGMSREVDCAIEAYPEAVNYWERHDGKEIHTQEGKYTVRHRTHGKYTSSVSLNVSLDSPMDFGTYYCISKNTQGLTKASVTIFGKKPK